MCGGCMKKKLGVILSFIMLAVCSVLFLPSNNDKKFVSAEYQTEYSSGFLYNDNLPEKSYESTVVAGYTNGYGKYTKGESADVLSVRAEDGFEIVGWRIQYENGSGLIQYINTDSASDYKKDQADYESNYKMQFTLTFEDKNNDGKNDYGTINIDKCLVDMIVKPVYNYIYHNVLIEDFDKLSFTQNKSVGENILYYNANPTVVGSADKYENVVVKIGDQYVYFEELYNEGSSWYTLHSNNHKTVESIEDLKIDYTLGAYRYGDEVDVAVSFKKYIDVTAIQVKNNKKSYLLTKDTDGSLLTNEYSKEVNSASLHTESVGAKFKIDKEYLKETSTTFKVLYDELYEISLDLKIDNETLSDNYLVTSGEISQEELKTMLLKNISVLDYFSVIDISSLSYLVKMNVASIQCEENIYDESGKYLYYQFDCIQGYGDNPANLSNLNWGEKNSLEINYSSAKYKVTFKYVLENGTELIESTGFVKPSVSKDFELSRGKTQALNNTYIHDSTGFAYLETMVKGDTEGKNLNSDVINIKIDSTEPKNIEIQMVYSYIDYKVQVFQAKDFMIDGSYPLYSVTLNVRRGAQEYTSTLGYTKVANADKKEADLGSYYEYNSDGIMIKSTVFDGSKTYYINNVYGHDFDFDVHINDEIKLTAQVTNEKAFVFGGYRYMPSTEIFNNKYTKFDKGTINSYVDSSTTLKLYSAESPKTYNLIYKIDDEDFDDNKAFMAQIGIDNPPAELEYKYYSQVIDSTEEGFENYYEIYSNILTKSSTIDGNIYDGNKTYYIEGTIDNCNLIVVGKLTYNYKLTLKATSNFYDKNNDGVFDESEDSEEYYFVCVNFDKGGTALTGTSSDLVNPKTTKFTNEIRSDEIITVNYSEPKAFVNVVLNNPNAKKDGLYTVEYKDEHGSWAIFNTKTSNDQYYVENGTYYAPTKTIVRIKIDKSKVNPGYKFSSIIWEYPSSSTPNSNLTLTDEIYYIYEYELKGDFEHKATLNFDLINYIIRVVQNGAGLTDVPYDFDTKDGQQDLNINVENLRADIQIPKNYYLSDLYIPTSKPNSAYINANMGLTQTNTDVKYDYSLDFSDKAQAFLMVAGFGAEVEDGTLIILKVNYTIHTTHIDFMYGLNASDTIKNMVYNIFPTVEASDNSIQTENITERGIPIGIRFKDVPFGSSIEFNAGILEEGLEYSDHSTDGNTITYSNIGGSWSKDNLKNGENVITDEDFLNLILTQYNVKLNMTYNGGRPHNTDEGLIYTTDNNKLVAEPTCDSVSLYSYINFDAQANHKNGIKFVSMHYFSRSEVSEEDFEESKESLYIYENGEFLKVTDQTFDQNTTYYEKNKIETNTYSEMFTPNDFGVIGKEFNLYVEYTDYLFELDFTAKEDGDTESLNYDPINLSPSDYASYTIYANGVETTTLKFNDKVVVMINLNESYPLKNGVELTDVKVNGNNLNKIEGYEFINVSSFEENVEYFKIVDDKMEPVDEDEPMTGVQYYIKNAGSYIVTFEVDEDIAEIVRNDKLGIELIYIVNEKSVIVKTNIEDVNFFKGNDSLLLTLSNTILGKDNDKNTGEDYKIDYNNARFLSQSDIRFIFNGNFATYFEIKDFKVKYSENGVDFVELAKNEYELFGINNIYEKDVFKGVTCNHIVKGIISIEFTVTPIIKYNADKDEGSPNTYIFTKQYKESGWIGQPNGLSKGALNTNDIIASTYVSDQMTIKYYQGNVEMQSTPVNAGVYRVEISFSTSQWWRFINIDDEIILNITPKVVSLYYNTNISSMEKTYDGKSTINQGNTIDNQEELFKNLYVVKDNKSYKLSECDGLKIATNALKYKMGTCDEHGTFIEQFKVSNDLYNVQVSGIALIESDFNRNYMMSTESFVTEPLLRVNMKDVYIEGLQIYNKVYDETNVATYYLIDGKYELKGVLDKDNNSANFDIDFDLAKFTFADNSEIGLNKPVSVDLSGALLGEFSGCYNVVAPTDLKASIYPYSVEAELDGVGKVTIVNKRGRDDCTNQDMVKLIPIDAVTKKPKLVVKEIEYETEKYFEIYDKIASFMSKKKYKKGFALVLSANNTDTALSNYLYLALPDTKDNQTILYATENNAGKFEMETIDGQLMFDLNNNTELLKAIIVLKDRTYLKWWQATLIIVGAAVVVGTAVAVFLVLRAKKKKQYKDKDVI